MNPIIIRPARHTDLDTLFRFEQGVIATERPFDPTLKEDPIHYYDLPAMIDAPEVALMVAESAGVLIGSGYARIEPAHRGKGINRMIIDALKAWALSRNIIELRLDVYSANTSAIKGYRPLMLASRPPFRGPIL